MTKPFHKSPEISNVRSLSYYRKLKQAVGRTYRVTRTGEIIEVKKFSDAERVLKLIEEGEFLILRF